jgi:hypothetical protein
MSDSATTDSESTAHLDGFRVEPDDTPDCLRVVIRLYANGVVCDGYEKIELFNKERTPNNEAAQERILLVGKALCTFLNAGGKKQDLWLLVDEFCEKMPNILSRGSYQLVSVLPPQAGVMLIWKRPDGTYLKVVEGEEGFTETLTEQEVKEVLGEQLKDGSKESEWPI